ncbi:DNA sulfur modification protein DndB [Sphingomonas naasensis]|uniref:DNA sulfur modification protein DndB n=1 Tax=Sphingomonas naasensis TaxID=1344951 RepID=A0A4S1WGX0_9SPHN|nr:DNA sulfur modification protein DndB [Sphingomonas naasensis]NIJ22057.1 DNA sulfur modification protein DndB [Sphingomonas naasensis]TGX42269.1 DNA sulfur modification protein DndB [Sphingomonas naasensis]
MDNSYSFAAIRGIQAGRAFYVAMIPLRMLERLFRYDEEELPIALCAQRDLNKTRIPAIARYVADNPSEYVLSALSATIDGAFEFEPVAGQRSVGTLEIDMRATILVNDGQHRRAGIIEALRDRPSLGDETIAVTLFPDEGLTRSQQMFVDLNQHGVKPARSLRLFYDGRDEGARLSRAVADAIPLFRELTDFTRSNLTAGSRKLFAFSNLHTAVSTLVADAGLTVTAADPDRVVEFWNAVIENMPDWTAAGRREVTPAELRRETVHAHGIALEAIAVVGARLMIELPDSWQVALEGLRDVDWSRSNTAIWEGRALVNGKINRSRASVLLTAELISRSTPPEVDDAARATR